MNETGQKTIDEFLYNISMVNNENVNQNNFASSYFQSLLTKSHNLNLILSIIDRDDLQENAYWIATIILQEKIRQPNLQFIQQNSDKIYESLSKAILVHQNRYQCTYYRSLVNTYVDFMVISNNLTSLPKQINHPIQCIYYSQMINTLNSTYIFSFFTEDLIFTLLGNALSFGNEYINSLSDIQIEQKVNQEWILLFKTLLQNDINIIEFNIILETIDYAIQKSDNSLYNELSELICVILNNYSFLPSMDSSCVFEESIFFYPLILKKSFIFTDILVNENNITLFLNLWTDILQFPILETIQSFEDEEAILLFSLFLSSLSKAILIFESLSIFYIFDIIGKFPSIFEYINEEFLNLQITTDFFNNIIHHLVDLLSDPALWDNGSLEQSLSFLYRLVPQLFSFIITDSQPSPAIFYVSSTIKNLPKEVTVVILKNLFSLDSIPSSGLLFIRSNLNAVLDEYPNSIPQLFVNDDKIKSDSNYFLFASFLLKEIILKTDTKKLCFDIFDQKIIDFLNKAVSLNSDFFNINCFTQCLVCLILLSLRLNDDLSRFQLFQNIKQALTDFIQFFINSKFMNDPLFELLDAHYSNFIHDAITSIGQIEANNENEVYFLIASTITENIDDRLLTTLIYDSQQIAISLINSILNHKLFQFLSKETIAKIVNWIIYGLTNNFYITGYIDVLMSLFHLQVYPPNNFIYDFLYHMSVINNGACEMLHCCANYLYEIIKFADDAIWHFSPPSFLVALSCSQYPPTNELFLRIVELIATKYSEIPFNYGTAICASLVVVFFNASSKSLEKAAEIVSDVWLRGGCIQFQNLIAKMAESAIDMKPLLECLYEALNAFLACKSEGKLCLMRFASQLKFFLIDHFDIFQCALQSWCGIFYNDK